MSRWKERSLLHRRTNRIMLLAHLMMATGVALIIFTIVWEVVT